ncbi:MAG: class I SAM-dependent methyltransferase, partial [Flavobacteriales bacterium]|nr:class I SAM-dependent methyltransferase [Flavobacteriales bacterium]
NANLNTDISKLLFKGSPFAEVDIKELVNQIEAKKKSRIKLSTWYKKEEIVFPAKLSIEQTSSEKTAEFKASLFEGKKAIDLTGGFGVDTFYFSKRFEHFTHCEYTPELSEIVKHNFKIFNKNNVDFVSGDGLKYLKNTKGKFDLIYLDPARRSDVKGKVFMLADTQPNPVENLKLLFLKSDNILIKVSPILDIKNTLRELTNVKSIYIVSLNDEVKELLFHLEKGCNTAVNIECVDLYYSKEKTQNSFSVDDSNFQAEYSQPKKYIYEPSATVLKAGAFNQISEKLGLYKIAPNSHLYTSDELKKSFQGRVFEVTNTSKPNKKEIKKILPSLKANITTRNFPMSVVDIRKKFKVKDGGEDYLFFTTDNSNQTIIIYGRKILQTS